MDPLVQFIAKRKSQSLRVFIHRTCYALYVFAYLSTLAIAEAKSLADYPNQVKRDGELVVLPDKGTVYVATDFQAQWSNFNRWLTQTRLVERIEAGEDVYGLILGDAVDHKPGDPIFEPYGDVKIVDRIMQLQHQLGEERLIYLRGNHELASADTYAMLKKAGMNPDNRRAIIDQLYQTIQGAYFKQFNFIERMTDEHYDYLINLPTVAIGKNGFVGVHAGTSRAAKTSLTSLAQAKRCSTNCCGGDLLSCYGVDIPRPKRLNSSKESEAECWLLDTRRWVLFLKTRSGMA